MSSIIRYKSVIPPARASLKTAARRADKPNGKIMQLRVARLCLDCEELYVGESCPVCASERSAFLSTWLPSDERRRWRRPAPRGEETSEGYFPTVKRLLSRWFGDEGPGGTARRLKTRTSDHVPNLDFDEPAKESPKQAARTAEPIKSDVR
jgi:hypothetical protein